MNHGSWRRRAAALAACAILALGSACGTSTSGGNGGGGESGDGGASTSTSTSTSTTTTTTSTGSGGEKACVAGGCSGQLCEEEGTGTGSTCEWNDVYACYQQLGICERDAMGACGWRDTPELEACVAAGGRLPASGQCVRNQGDACESDIDCQAGGCGGELCFNPAASSGVSTCDCTAPVGPSCGCVNGLCAWWNAP